MPFKAFITHRELWRQTPSLLSPPRPTLAATCRPCNSQKHALLTSPSSDTIFAQNSFYRATLRRARYEPSSGVRPAHLCIVLSNQVARKKSSFFLAHPALNGVVKYTGVGRRNSADADKPRDAFRSQSRSPNS